MSSAHHTTKYHLQYSGQLYIYTWDPNGSTYLKRGNRRVNAVQQFYSYAHQTGEELRNSNEDKASVGGIECPKRRYFRLPSRLSWDSGVWGREREKRISLVHWSHFEWIGKVVKSWLLVVVLGSVAIEMKRCYLEQVLWDVTWGLKPRWENKRRIWLLCKMVKSLDFPVRLRAGSLVTLSPSLTGMIIFVAQLLRLTNTESVLDGLIKYRKRNFCSRLAICWQWSPEREPARW